ncbi:ribonucleotide-diphosphate reductase subunit beta, partial [Sphingobacterium multivorum]
LSYMCMMEAIHAKSYSTIFTTVSTTAEINDIFEWVQQNKYLQYKAETIDGYYRAIDKEDASDEEIYMAMAASVLLESFLFYSGFFLPLWLCGQGEMVASADIIKKIIADESIHGVFVGLIAQDQFKKLKNQDQVKARFLALLYNLYENELKYTEEIYTEVGLTAEVKEYVRYNANKALMNLGFDPIFEVKQVNPIVLNGLNTETTQHDFFSKKSTNYEKATEIVHLKDDDFKMDVVVDI